MGKSLRGGDLVALSLHELSGMIRNKQITSRELVELYLERIRKIDGANGINAYITVMGETSLQQAEGLDRLAEKNRFKGILHGLPIAIKDNLDTAGIRTTGGSKILSDWRPLKDAHVVRRLKDAGAVILGKTNMDEFALGVTTNNPHYGPTRNPHDFSHTPGGSSGGSGAAVAATLCAGAIGTDTGGSVTIPAALCGTVGLKPTLGRVGRGGVICLSFTRDVVGPITKTVTDSAIVLEAIGGKDPRDPESSSNPVPHYIDLLSKWGIKGKRFGLPRKYFFEIIHPEVERVINEAIREIQNMGGMIKEVEVEHMDLANSTRLNIFFAESIYLIETYLSGFDSEATIEKYFDRLGFEARARLGSQKGTPESKPVPAYVYVKSVREDRNKIIAGFEKGLSGLDALLLPATPLPATRIAEKVDIELEGEKLNIYEAFIRNCYPINIVGYPAITVPAGYSKTGLPIGLQIVGRPWEEDKLLGMAYAFEQATKVWRSRKLCC